MSRGKPRKQYWKVGIDGYGGAILTHFCKWNVEATPAKFEYVLLSRGKVICPVCRSSKVSKKIRLAFDVTNQMIDED